LFDRFDWVNNEQNEEFQEIMLPYLDLFYKAIITTDDPTVYSEEERQSDLLQKGFSVVAVDYGKDEETAKAIISRDINYRNQNGSFGNSFIPDIKGLITPETYNILIKKAGGDFHLLFDTILEFYNHLYSFRSDEQTYLHDQQAQVAFMKVQRKRAEIDKKHLHI
jgi:hypothetical protein